MSQIVKAGCSKLTTTATSQCEPRQITTSVVDGSGLTTSNTKGDRSNSSPSPFLKWAGGKRSLLDQYREHLPSPGEFNNYHEPFLGSGAVFLGLYAEWLAYRFFEQDDRLVFLSDANPRLVNLWEQVQANPNAVIEQAFIMFAEMKIMSQTEREGYYGFLRKRFNSLLVSGDEATLASRIDSAAIFIFLNRWGFNGLYRENQAGRFNVPLGTRKNDPSVPSEAIWAASEDLLGVDLRCGDYAATLTLANPGDFVYLDPPYYPVKKTSFTGYCNQFTEQDHSELAALVKQLTQNGVKVAVSNSDCAEVRRLYNGFRFVEYQRSGRMNSRGSGRQAVGELLILNY